MKTITLLAAMAGMIIGVAGPASAQGIYLDFGNNPGPRYRDYDGPRYRDYDGPRYRDRQRYGERGERGYYPPSGRFKTFNGCQNGWTVQDGLCKPYRGYWRSHPMSRMRLSVKRVQYWPGSHVPDAVQREALAERCAADPGPSQSRFSTVLILQAP